LVDQLAKRLAAGVVDVVDCVGVEDEPVWRLLDIDEAEHLFGETLGVGVEDADPEAVDHQSWLGERSRRGHANSSLRSRRMPFMFAMSISFSPIRKTPEESTAFGRYWSGLVRKSGTITTTTAVVSWALRVWLFASSTRHLTAYAREVAALWASMTRNIEAEVAIRAAASVQVPE
jgi:hypothetical protein